MEPHLEIPAMTSGLATVAATAAVLDVVPTGMHRLTDAERGRAARLRRVSDRHSFVAAHLLARLCSSYLFGLPPTVTLVQSCVGCGGPHGPARLREVPEAGVSMSRAGGVVAAAVAPVPVGIDVEPLASASAVADRGIHIAAPAERRALATVGDADESLLLLWVRKEALVKLGLSTLDGMAELDLSALPLDSPNPGQHRRLAWGRYSIVDLCVQTPHAVGAVVSQCTIDVVSLNQIAARYA